MNSDSLYYRLIWGKETAGCCRVAILLWVGSHCSLRWALYLSLSGVSFVQKSCWASNFGCFSSSIHSSALPVENWRRERRTCADNYHFWRHNVHVCPMRASRRSPWLALEENGTTHIVHCSAMYNVNITIIKVQCTLIIVMFCAPCWI